MPGTTDCRVYLENGVGLLNALRWFICFAVRTRSDNDASCGCVDAFLQFSSLPVMYTV